MASRREVTCINKSNRQNPHERITHIGGRNADGTRWRLTQQDALAGIDEKKWEFYVNKGGREVKVIPAIREGYRYLKTEADGVEPNNLLSLVECQ